MGSDLLHALENYPEIIALHRAYAEQELGGMRFCIYGVEPGFEVEFQLDGDAIRSVTLYPTADKQNRLSITDGVTAAVFDLFVERP